MSNNPEVIDSRSVPRAYLFLKARAKGKRLEVIVNDDREGVLFWEARPVAIIAGGCCYYLDMKWPGGVTKAIHEWAEHKPLIRSAASDFDFVLGSLLTKVGIPLTRRS